MQEQENYSEILPVGEQMAIEVVLSLERLAALVAVVLPLLAVR